MENVGDSLNVYESLVQITERSPEELVAAIRSIRTPIKIISIVASGGRHTAYITAPLLKQKAPLRSEKDGRQRRTRQKSSRS